jgi:hypothetical protein
MTYKAKVAVCSEIRAKHINRQADSHVQTYVFSQGTGLRDDVEHIDHWRWEYYVASKRQDPITQWSSVA